MRPVTLASGSRPHGPTVYSVLAQSARSHSGRYLAVEALLAGTAAVLVLVWQPPWWPIASLASAVGLYASWGLVAREPKIRARAPSPRLLGAILAGLATAATLAGLGGLAVKAFWGTAPAPYGVCYRPDGTSYACHADGSRRQPASRPPS